MDTHYQLPTITPSGYENNQGVHVCHKCGWPFPKLHPSSKHRRAHKRICGTIEGYKLTRLSISDDEQDHPSDDDCKTPSPKIEKRSISGVGERSYRSEDEVFSDAVAEFSDSGISPGSEEQLEDVKELEKTVKKTVDDDIYSTGTLKVDADCDFADFVKPMGSQPDDNIVLSSGLVESTHSGKAEDEMSNHGISLFSASVQNTEAIVDAVQIKEYLAQDTIDNSSHLSEIYVTNTEEKEATHVHSVSNDLPIVENADIMLKDTENQKMLKSDFPLVLGSADVEGTLKKDNEDMPEDQLIEPAKILTGFDCGRTAHDLSHLSGCAKQEPSSGTVHVEVDPTQDEESGTYCDSVEICNTYRETEETMHVLSVASDLLVVDHADLMLQDFKDHRTFKSGFPPIGSENVIRSLEGNEESPLKLHSVKLCGASNSLADMGDVEEDMITVEGPDNEFANSSKSSVTIGKTFDNEDLEVPPIPSRSNRENSQLNFSLQRVEPFHEANHTESIDTLLSDCDNNNHNLMARAEEDTEGNENSETVTRNEHSAEAKTILLYEDSNQAPKLRHDNGGKHIDVTMNFSDEAWIAGSTEAAAIEKLSTPSMTDLEPEHEHSSSKHTESPDIKSSDRNNNNHYVTARAEEVHTEGNENSERVVRNEHFAETNTILVNKGGSQAPKLRHNNGAEHLNVTLNLSDEAWIDDSTEVAAVEKFSTPTMSNFEPEHELSSSNYSESILETPVSSINTNVSATIMPAHPSSRKFSDNDFQEVSTEPELHSGNGIVVKCVDGGVIDSKFIQSGDFEVEEDNSKRPMRKEPETLPIHSEISHESLLDTKSGNEMDGKFEIMQKSDVKVTRQAGDASAVNLSGDLGRQTESVEGNWGSFSVHSPQSDQPVAGTEVQSKADPEEPDKSECTKLDQEVASERLDLRKADVSEPPSFMTLVEPRGGLDQENASSEIETVQATQHAETEVLPAGWLPLLSNVVNESPGRKKNEEMIAKVTNWSTAKQHSTPLKNLLGEAKVETRTKSPSPEKTETSIQTDATEAKSNVSFATTVKEVLGSEASAGDRTVRGVTAEEWNSPARYPVEIKKQKKKAHGKPFWVPFACCSSVN